MTDLFDMPAPTDLDRAKAALRARAKPDGSVMGANTTIMAGLGIGFWPAVMLAGILVDLGFITASDDDGRSILLENCGQIAIAVSITNEEMAAGP